LAQEALVKQVSPKLSELRAIGKSVKRKEDYRLLTGLGKYVDDVRLPNLYYAKFVRSEYAHAIIENVSFDSIQSTSQILLFSGSDITSGASFKPIVNIAPPWKPISIFPLAVKKVRYVGEPVAVLIGRDPGEVEDALEKVTVDYRQLPCVVDPEQALERDAPLLYEEWGTNKMGTEKFEKGNPSDSFKHARHVFKERFLSHRYTGAPIETRGCVSSYDRASGLIMLHTSTQWPHLLSSIISQSLGYPQNRVRVISPEVGGGFGVKNHFYNEEIVLPWLALKTGLSIKWIEERSEHMMATNHAREQVHDIELAIGDDSSILAIRDHVIGDLGAGSLAPYNGIGPVRVAAFVVPGAYKVRNYECIIDCVVTNKTPAGAYRGFGQTEGVFAIERILDIVAAELKLDPLEFRLRNLVGKNDLPYITATGNPLDTGSFKEACELAGKLIHYSEFRDRQRIARRDGRYLGISVMPFIEGTAPTLFGQNGMTGGFDSATVRMESDGRVSVFTGVNGTGSGLETSLAQVTSDALGVPIEWVTVYQGDSMLMPFGLGSWGSRSLVVAGGAISLASSKLKKKILLIASRIRAVPESELVISGEVVERLDGSMEPLPLCEIARLAYVDSGKLPADIEPTLEFTARFDPSIVGAGDDSDPSNQSRSRWVATVSNGAFAIITSVDPETGVVKILDCLIVDDCGRVVNPMIVDGQLHGGVAQGLGGALFEELAYNQEGALLASTFADYLVPTALDLPTINTAHIESPSLNVPFGIKGVGEAGVISPPAALAGSIDDALSEYLVRTHKSHFKPEYVWKLAKEKKG
jgi:carbon-monoxide dehydrogenase large subunit